MDDIVVSYLSFRKKRKLFVNKISIIGTNRNGLLAAGPDFAGPDFAGPDFAGYQSIIRSAGFCRTVTGVMRVKYKAAGA